jgi:phosphomannomutase
VFFDERGITVPSDLIAALLARMFIEREPGAAVVFDLRATDILQEEIERVGGVPVRSRVGQVMVKKTMIERNAVFGCDMAGRYYFRTNAFCESAMLAFVYTLNVVAAAGRRLGDLVRPLQRYRSSGEIRVASSDPGRVIQSVAAAHEGAQIDDLDGITIRYPDWSFNLRREATEPAVRLTLQARTRKIVDTKLSELHSLLDAQ